MAYSLLPLGDPNWGLQTQPDALMSSLQTFFDLQLLRIKCRLNRQGISSTSPVAPAAHVQGRRKPSLSEQEERLNLRRLRR